MLKYCFQATQILYHKQANKEIGTMLNHTKLTQIISKHSKKIAAFSNHTSIKEELSQAAEGLLKDIVAVHAQAHPYTVIGIDGSQIYPDRHRGNRSLFLLNIGGCTIIYRQKESDAFFFSEPGLYDSDEMFSDVGTSTKSSTLIDLEREAQELNHYITVINQHTQAQEDPLVCLLDGSLIFYNLQHTSDIIRTNFFNRFMNTFSIFHANKLLHAAYISLPQNHDLADHFADTDLMTTILKPGQRSGLFPCIYDQRCIYPEPLKPWFFYLHTGHEIGRIEVPTWIAQKSDLVEIISCVVMDQCTKGYGYPVVLAEAHQQAVVTAHDQELFYQILEHTGMSSSSAHLQPSQKLLKKRRLHL